MDSRQNAMVIVNILIGIALVIGIVMLVVNIRKMRVESAVGDKAASFLYTSLDGRVEEWSHPGEHLWITYFVFMDGCPHCRDIMPFWNELAGEDGTHFGEIMGLSISPMEETIDFIVHQDAKFPVVLIGGEFMDGYRIHGTPTTITIHRGVIERVIEGMPTADDSLFLTQIHRKGIR